MSRIRLTNKSSLQESPPEGKLQLEAVNGAFVVQNGAGEVASFSGVNTGDQSADGVPVETTLNAGVQTVQDIIDTQLSTGIVGDDELISDAGSGTVNVASATVAFRTADDSAAPLTFVVMGDAEGVEPDDGVLSYIYAEYNGGTPLYVATTSERTDTNTNVLIGTVYRNGTTVHINNNFRVRANDNMRRVALRFVDTMPFARSSGGIVSEVGTRNLHITAGRWWECTNPFTTPTFDSSDADTFTAAYSDGSDGWTEQVAQTQIDNAYYDDLTGTLAEALPSRYLTRWVYLETDGHVVVVYGRAQHVTEALAEAEAEPPRLPRIQAAGRLLARIIIQVGASAFTSIKNVDAGMEFTSPTTHNGLGGLQGGEAGFYGHLTEAQQTSAPVEFGDSAGLDVGVANGVAGLDANGLVPITQIPPAAIERLTVVADESARFALTTATVQEGDTVKQADTGLMYLVVDEDNLGNASGYVEYTAGRAASVAYSGITGKPVAIDALDDLTPDADKLPYYTGGSSAALADLTAAGRALLGDADAAAQRETLDVFGKTDLDGSVGNLTAPLCHLPLRGPDDAIQLQGDFQYLCESDATYIDRYGVLQKCTYYSGTPTATDGFSITDSGATFGDLSGYVVYLTDGANVAYRWVDAATATKVLWRKPVAFTPTSYKLSRPRFERDGLLIEGASTNLCTYSEEFDNAAWAKTRISVETNVTAAPDGTVTADKIIPSDALGTHSVSMTFPIAAGNSYTLSVYAKANEYGSISFNISDANFGVNSHASFDLVNGVAVASAGTVAITAVNNGWYLCSYTSTAIAGTSDTFQILVAETYPGGALPSFVGDGTSGVYVWGAQIEALPFASSYIPTTSAAVTKLVGVGKLSARENVGSGSEALAFAIDVSLKKKTTNNQYIVQVPTTSGEISLILRASDGHVQATYGSASVTSLAAREDTTATYLVTYDGASVYLYIDGVLQGVTTVVTPPTVDASGYITLGDRTIANRPMYGHVAHVRFWPAHKSSAEARLA